MCRVEDAVQFIRQLHYMVEYAKAQHEYYLGLMEKYESLPPTEAESYEYKIAKASAKNNADKWEFIHAKLAKADEALHT